MSVTKERVIKIREMLDGKISCWQDNELYWCLKTILKQTELHEKTSSNLVECRRKLKEIEQIIKSHCEKNMS